MEMGQFDSSLFSPPLMLAIVAAIGYWVGRRRLVVTGDDSVKNRQELLRALDVAKELESITNRLRKSISAQVPAVNKFNSQLAHLEETDQLSWYELSERVSDLLKPAMRLGAEISNAHSSILQQMTQLSLFAELRTDPLTGAANRRTFDESLESVVKQYARYRAPVAVAMLDIDYFKRVNDQHGHVQGDIALRELAELLKGCLRECDTLARYGGEEFAIIMPHTALAAATALGERLRAAIEKNMLITVSIGVAELVLGDDPSTLVQRADAALYQAKLNGRNRVYAHEGICGRIVEATSLPVGVPTDVDSAAVDHLMSHEPLNAR
jgi:diguanylate cyclase (GGDEF)-like protein